MTKLRRKKSKREYGRCAAACLALFVGGCGSEEEKKPRAQAPPEPAVTETAPADIKDTTQKPVVPEPSGKPPRKLRSEDIVKGTGTGAKAGDTLSVQYVGVSFSTGQQFDASWDSGQPFQFQLGAGGVIPGWDEGLVGIRKGGRRQLTIPPDLAYGAQGSPPAIGPNETLVFVIDRVN